jgi:hypothetical protein
LKKSLIVFISALSVLVACQDTASKEEADAASEDVEEVSADEEEIEEEEEVFEADEETTQKEKEIVEEAVSLLTPGGGYDAEAAYKVVYLYDEFESEYIKEARIAFFVAKIRLTIDEYRDNMETGVTDHDHTGRYDNGVSYRQELKDDNTHWIYDFLQETDPEFESELFPDNFFNGIIDPLGSFFDITEGDWKQAYADQDTDYGQAAAEEAYSNKKLTDLHDRLPEIGMTQNEVRNTAWGSPDSVNKTTTANGVNEQWVYPRYKYVYFEDGVVTSIQE